jgi:hypothetical protein
MSADWMLVPVADEKPLALVRVPLDVHATLRVVGEVEDVRAVAAVYRHPAATGDVADHVIPRDRLAALGVTDHEVVHPLDADALLARANAVDELGESSGRPVTGRRFFLGKDGSNRLGQPQIPATDSGVEPFGAALERQLPCRFVELILFRSPPELLPLAVEDLLAEMDRRLVLLPTDPLVDLAPCPTRTDKTQPISAGGLGVGGDDLHRIAVAQRSGERRDPAVHTRPRASRADLRMHGESEVDRRGALRKLLHVACGGEDEDLVVIKVDLQELHELFGLSRLLLPLQDLPEPGELLVQLVFAPDSLLVAPVGRDTELSRSMHVVGSNLDLVQTTTRTEHGGMEASVQVGLGTRDVVVEALGERRPLVVDHAERVIAVPGVGDDDAHREHIVDLVVRLVPLHHLPVDGPQMLGPAVDLGAHSGGLQLRAQRLLHPSNQLFPLAPLVGDPLYQLPVLLRLEKLEGQVLELPLHASHAQSVSERGVDLACLERDALPLLLGQVL